MSDPDAQDPPEGCAEQVQEGDRGAVRVGRADVGQRGEAVNAASSEVNRNINELGEETPDRIRETFLRRWEEVCVQQSFTSFGLKLLLPNQLLDRACQNPAYRASLLTILSLLEKYYTLAYSTASRIPSDTTSATKPPASQALTRIRCLLPIHQSRRFAEASCSPLPFA